MQIVLFVKRTNKTLVKNPEMRQIFEYKVISLEDLNMES